MRQHYTFQQVKALLKEQRKKLFEDDDGDDDDKKIIKLPTHSNDNKNTGPHEDPEMMERVKRWLHDVLVRDHAVEHEKMMKYHFDKKQNFEYMRDAARNEGNTKLAAVYHRLFKKHHTMQKEHYDSHLIQSSPSIDPLKRYEATKKSYKNSVKLLNSENKIMNRLENDPEHRFLHNRLQKNVNRIREFYN